jgi:SAM-dependent methyltransferase
VELQSQAKSASFRAARLLWRLIPEDLRKSSVPELTKKKVLSLLGAKPFHEVAATVPEKPTGLRTLSTLAELDAVLKELDAAAAISDDELLKGFSSFEMKFPLPLPTDPDSPEYRQTQFQLYEWLHGKPYGTANEVTAFNVAGAIQNPYPFYTRSPEIVGNQLVMMSVLLKGLKGLPPGARLLEFGPGWGNTTLTLARMGYQVTAVDIEKNFVELIRGRANQKQLTVEAIHDGFLTFSPKEQFDAVVFFECFHHCSDHLALLSRLDSLVAPGGRVVFASEPIFEEFPQPWGFRLDGQSLWAIRRHGWMELGFKESYFRATMDRLGWRLEKSASVDVPWANAFVAHRKS